MSGGRWAYMEHKLREMSVDVQKLLEAVAQSEHIVDWSECSDTSRADAEKELYDLWVKTFDEVSGATV